MTAESLWDDIILNTTIMALSFITSALALNVRMMASPSPPPAIDNRRASVSMAGATMNAVQVWDVHRVETFGQVPLSYALGLGSAPGKMATKPEEGGSVEPLEKKFVYGRVKDSSKGPPCGVAHWQGTIEVAMRK